MVFSSTLFIFGFLPLALALYYAIWYFSAKSSFACCIALTALSVAFYYFGSGTLVYLLLVSILFNWYLGSKLEKAELLEHRRNILIAGIVINIAALVYFKYARFALDAVGTLSNHHLFPSFQPPLPVGVSFFTFMCVAYLVDVYQRRHSAAPLHKFATYLTLFPHLVAGPIVRYSELAPDLEGRPRTTSETFIQGVGRFSLGLGMKVLLANNLAVLADNIFAIPRAELSASVAWLGALAYTFQIYFDFAGYSTMAIGIAMMFGFHFPENFDQPYRARSITEFWRRWHMSLSRFFRDYLYIPLGGNRAGTFKTYRNLLIVFGICGLWHGAAWTFVIWGLYHGVLLIAERVAAAKFGYAGTGLFGMVLTFILTLIGWVLFRSANLEEAAGFISRMFSLATSSGGASVMEFLDAMTTTTLLFAFVFSFTPASFLEVRRGWVRQYVAPAVCLALLVLGSAYSLANSYKPFIYFRF